MDEQLTPDELAELAQLESKYGDGSVEAQPSVAAPLEPNREIVQEVLPSGEKITVNQPKNEISQTQSIVRHYLMAHLVNLLAK